MQKRLRREDDMECLPSLGQQGDSSRVPPNVLRFKETPQTSTLPELVLRRESVISTYRSELYLPRVVTFMKNGDKYFEGLKVNVSSRNFRHWEVLLSELSRSIGLPAGVRNIYTPDSGHRVTNLEQFKHQRVYVCASTEPFKKMCYTKVKTPTWHSGTKVKHSTGTLLDLSRSVEASGGPLLTSLHTQRGDTVTISTSTDETLRQRKRKTGCVRKLTFPPLSQPTDGDRFGEASRSPPRRRTRQSSSSPLQPSQFTIICSGPPPRKVVTVFLDRPSISSWEQAYSLICQSLPTGPANSSRSDLRLHSVDGVEVKSLSQLWATDRVLIAADGGEFSRNLLHDIEGSTAVDDSGGVWANQETISGQQKRGRGEKTETRDELEDTRLGGFSGHNQQTLLAAAEGKEGELQAPFPGEREGEGRREEGDTNVDSEVGAEGGREEGDGENGQERPRAEGESVTSMQKIDISQTNLVSRTSPANLVSTTSLAEPGLSGLAGNEEVHPTNSVLTLTEDGSLLGAGSPLTVDRVAAVQHLHRLALQYDTERASISGSERSTDLRLSSRPSVLCPQTPQSNISFSQPRSLVEMIMPRENSGVSMDSVSSSSRNSSQQQKSRTIGIQTELVGDKLSAIIEEVEQPPHLGNSHRKRRATHPLFHTQTSVTAAGQSPRESYRVGSVVGEGHYVVVRDCHHKVTGQHYSLRVINKAGVFGHEDLVLRECQLLRGLKHDNLVQMVDGWESSDEICLVAEHIEGTDLFDAVLHCQHFCESDATHAMRQLSMALVYLHAHKIVHRDVKLENIFLHQAGEGRWSLKLGGMGLAATVSEPLSLVCGNIFYMAPEMIAETGYGTKLDVWAAGVVCCTFLSGIMPFGSNSKRATVSNIQKGRYAFLSPFWDSVSDKAKDFVRRLLVVPPSQRFMATQMLQHPWLEKERWEEADPRDIELNRVLMEHLVSKSATAINAALPTLLETALDKRKSLPNMDLLKRTSTKTHKL